MDDWKRLDGFFQKKAADAQSAAEARGTKEANTRTYIAFIRR